MKRTILAACAVLLASGVALAQAPAAAPPPYGAPITLEQAKLVVAAAEAETKKRGATATIVVVEPNGTIVLSERMTGASYSSAQTAPNKARSAAAWMRPTSAFIESSKTNPAVLEMAEVVAAQGGELIISGGRIIGAIGIGGAGANEADIAKIAVATIK